MRKQLYPLLVFVFLVNLVPTALFSKVWYVNGSALGSATGADWPNAFLFLQQALSVAQAGDSVWVAQGVYYPTTVNSRTRSFEVPSGVVLLGGFYGNEQSAADRNWEVFPTILSGDIGAPGISSDNSYNVVYMYNPALGTLMDGFSIQDGRADGMAPPGTLGFPRRLNGAAIYIDAEEGEGYPTFLNCRFEENFAQSGGGGVFLNGGYTGSVAARFERCTFKKNKANDGGGFYRFGGSEFDFPQDFLECHFEDNEAVNGGGLCIYDGEGTDRIDIINCAFVNNTGSINGGGLLILANRGPAGSKIRIDQCNFNSCVSSRGAALGCFSTFGYGAEFVLRNSLIESCTLIDTLAENGGVVVDLLMTSASFFGGNDAVMLIDKCTFLKNYSFSILGCGGPDFIKVRDCKFIENTGFGLGFNQIVDLSNGTIAKGIDFENTVILKNQFFTAFFTGPFQEQVFKVNNSIFEQNHFKGGLLTRNNNLNKRIIFANCTFANNTGEQLLPPPNRKLADFYNCIFYKNDHKLIRHFTSPFSDTYYCAIQDDCPTQPSTICATSLRISEADFIASDDFRPSPCSKLIDAGTTQGITLLAKDLANQPRIAGNTIDIGAYEFQGAPGGLQFAGPPNILPPCNEMQQGAVYFNLQGACQTLSYNWNNITTGATGTGNTNLSPGEYYFTITDGYTAQLLDTISLIANNGMQVSADLMPVDCGSAQGGSIAVLVQGGSAPYGYQWGHGGNGPVQQNLEPGFYTLTIADESNCKITQSFEIGLSGALALQLDSLPVTCADTHDGRLEVKIPLGIPPFLFQWSDGVFTPLRDSLSPGIYQVSVTDSYGCTGEALATLAAPQPLSESVVVQNASDALAADGVISVWPSGGSPPYTFEWASGSTQNPYFGLTAGAYPFTITDAHGCTRTGEATVGVTVSAGAPPAPNPIQLFPNPANNLVYLSYELHSPEARFELLNSLGQVLRSLTLAASDGAVPVSLGDLPVGMYFYRLLEKDSELQSGTLMIQR